jgi:uncharacterized protein
MSDLKRLMLVTAGTCSVVLAVIGVFVPVLPTTPFLLLAAALYARSSKRFYRWLLGQRYLGAYIRNYREGRGIPMRTKVVTLALLWITIGSSAILVVESLILRLLLAAVAVGVTVHIVRVSTRCGRENDDKPSAGTAGSGVAEEDVA